MCLSVHGPSDLIVAGLQQRILKIDTEKGQVSEDVRWKAFRRLVETVIDRLKAPFA